MGKPDTLLWKPDHDKGASDNKDIVLLRPELIAVRALEGLHLEGLEQDMHREIHQGNCKRTTRRRSLFKLMDSPGS